MLIFKSAVPRKADAMGLPLAGACNNEDVTQRMQRRGVRTLCAIRQVAAVTSEKRKVCFTYADGAHLSS
jgi:hypothetical protein